MLSNWRAWRASTRYDIVAVDERDVMRLVDRLAPTTGALPPPAKRVHALQAQCLVKLSIEAPPPRSPDSPAGERGGLYPGKPGVVELQNPTIVDLAVLTVLRQNLLLASAKRDLHHKLFFLALFLAWSGLARYGVAASIVGAASVLFVAASTLPQCVQVVATCCSLGDQSVLKLFADHSDHTDATPGSHCRCCAVMLRQDVR